MYKTIIEFHNELPKEKIEELFELCNKAFDNRAGRAVGRIESQNHISYEGDEGLYGCLDLGIIALWDNHVALKYIKSWKWIDEDPDECCDMLEVHTKYAG